ncbi:deoxyuridine 5'-triphosphate nucleotidohydrolase [Bacillus sp. 005/A4HT-01/001]|uniref:dUTP diphosphatase n=1 Tax=Bacillus sp. 005/A4HT-01/001 TaxID=2509010 RepID=UPI001074BAB3|nr:deoxyuridine 5'-triphosphate nucleotidohydrolase [Bacillus sp. 005/A4HT-01/001]TFW49239.1 deoxyuridine 5'-triphosphate nucleotidohydrolase [Bacillus sp. 005/A4HT-01/001]
MNVNIKRLSADATTPTYAHSTDACFDLYAAADVIIEPGETALVPTGLAFEIPSGYEMQIRPRSGITLKTNLRVQLGTVDSGYAGEVGVIVDNIAHREVSGLDLNSQSIEYITSSVPKVVDGLPVNEWDYYGDYPNRTYIVRKGDRLAQAVIKPVERATFTVVDALEETERGSGGFGSSGVGK